MMGLRMIAVEFGCGRALPWALLLCIAVGCSKSGSLGGDSEASSGGEDWGDEDNLAKEVPEDQRQKRVARQAGGKTVGSTKDYRPKLGKVRPVDTREYEVKAPSGPSPWGAADANSGRKLPKRPAMKSGAKSAYQEGLEAAARGDYPKARAAFERALAADPRSHEAAYNLGVVADRQGNAKKAVSHYERALRLQPDYERAVQGISTIRIRKGEPQSAVDFTRPIADKWERNLHLRAILADNLTAADRVDQAEEAARKALRRDERFVPAMVALAKASLKRGRVELADSILEQAVKIDRNNAELHFLIGERHRENGRLAQALASHRQAAKLRPDYAEARTALGLQYMAAGNYAQALEELQAVARLVPTQVAAHVNLGDAYRANGKYKEAKRSFDKALKMQSQLPEAHFNLGLMYMTAGDKFPGLNQLQALEKALAEMTTYRTQMGPKLRRDDPSTAFIADVTRQIDREKKRIEREAAQKRKEAERAARKAKMEAEK
ncbi:MAG: tetratricopeptide repeat protein [Myxococcales bacterium]|nr:tetratricopeptide repeat protein [Myxococcales bacterium]